jgi:hypothetical protein
MNDGPTIIQRCKFDVSTKEALFQQSNFKIKGGLRRTFVITRVVVIFWPSL